MVTVAPTGMLPVQVRPSGPIDRVPDDAVRTPVATASSRMSLADEVTVMPS